MELLLSFIWCFGAVYFFTFLFHAPARTQLFSALIGALGYVLYMVLSYNQVNAMVCYFCGTFLIAALSEIMAVVQRAPSTCFLHTAILGLVPGIGLYQTMNCFTLGLYEQGGEIGVRTVLIIGAMAMAVAVNLVTVRLIQRAGRWMKRRLEHRG